MWRVAMRAPSAETGCQHGRMKNMMTIIIIIIIITMITIIMRIMMAIQLINMKRI